MTDADHPKRDFTLTWTLAAPRSDVFRAWTDPDHLHWYYNDHMPTPTDPIEVDLRVGGEWRQRMVIDEDTTFMTGGIYREIVPGERLVFAWGATDGWPKLDPERLDDSPLVTVTLAESASGTEMNVHVELPAGLTEDAVREWLALGIDNGWRDTVDRLATAFARSSAAV